MSNPRDVAVFIGSLRKESFNRKIALALAEIAAPALRLEPIEIGHLGMYNQDLDAEPPKQWVEFRERIRRADAVLFVTPEYNRSVPAVLKNALDVGSRPYGKSAWQGKPGAIISATPGPLGAFGANHHLRQSLVFLDVPTMAQPEMYLAGVGKMFDDGGKLVDDGVRELLTKFAAAFGTWIGRHVG